MTVRSSDRKIRLLQLLPGNEGDEIRCTVRIVSLDQCPEYETVSYVWGDRKEEKEVVVSGTRTLITKNLHDGLRRLRYLTGERNLWIDQLCINQWDLEEKAAQVALMRDIYRQCTQCIAWMGELQRDGYTVPVQHAEAVFEFLRQVAAAESIPMHDLPVLFQDSTDGIAAREAFGTFSMYGNPWWSRIWTVQEAVIPPKGIFMWGSLCIPRKYVLAAARNLRDLQNLPSLPEGFATKRYAYTELLRRLLYPVHGFNHCKTDNATDLLMRWRYRKSTDPRDKVYALLGMIPLNAMLSARSCDYTTSVSQVFAKATMDLIKLERNLRPLLGACEMPQVTPGIPSWAIDFACCNRIGKRQLKWWGHSHRFKVFSAGGQDNLEILDSFGDSVLGLRGVNIDEILYTSELLRVDAQDAIHLDELRMPLANCLRLLNQHRKTRIAPNTYKDGHTWDSAFCRTLVGDLTMDELPLGRLESYGRANLEADFEHLFDNLHIQWATKISLDFAKETATVPRLRGESMAPVATISRKMLNPRLQQPEHSAFRDLYESLIGMMENQTFFITNTGYIGIGPPQVKPGDQVWVFKGGNVPFVMRKGKNQEAGAEQLTLIGDAYVHGVMYGEAVDKEPHVQTVHIR